MRLATPAKSERLKLTGATAAILVIAALLVVSLVFIKPAAPDRITLLTGPENSAYHDLGIRYAEDLRQRGLDVEVVITDGARDNVLQIIDGKDAIAFAPSAVDWKSEVGSDDSSLVALGSVGVEPVWLFHRSALSIARLSELVGRNVVTESQGAASLHIAEILIEKNGLVGQIELQPIGNEVSREELIQSLKSGAIDAIFITGHPGSPRVRALLHADLQFMSFDRAEAYAAQIPGITSLRAPEGMFDLGRNVPAKESLLLSKTTCLVADRKLHSAVVPLLLITAEDVRQSEMEFPALAAFPNSDHVTLPLHPAARRYFQQGEVGLSKYLPYRVTRFINHFGLFVLPLLTVAVVLLKAVPTCLKIWSNLRLKRMFKQLEAIEKRHAAGEETSALLVDLSQVGEASAAMYVPLFLSPDYVDFRQFLHDMRERIESQTDHASG